MICAGCVTSGEKPLDITLPTACDDQLAKRVADPADTAPNNIDARVLLGRYRRTVDLANRRIDALRACNEETRKLYEAKK